MGKHYDRECRVMDMVKQIIIWGSELNIASAVQKASEFEKVRERRLASAEVKDKEDVEKRKSHSTESNQERSGLREWDR